MSGFFDNFKKALKEGANQSAQKMEEAAKYGKTQLDILNENRKLNASYQALGKKLFEAQLEKKAEEFVDSEECIQNYGEIKLFLDEISRLKSTLSPEDRKAAEESVEKENELREE